MTEPGSYRLREDAGEPLIRGRMLRRLVPLMGVALVVAIVVPYLQRAPDEGSPSVMPTVLTVATTAIIGFVVYRRALARELEMWRSYRLALTSNLARRVASGVAPVEVLRSEV